MVLPWISDLKGSISCTLEKSPVALIFFLYGNLCKSGTCPSMLPLQPSTFQCPKQGFRKYNRLDDGRKEGINKWMHVSSIYYFWEKEILCREKLSAREETKQQVWKETDRSPASCSVSPPSPHGICLLSPILQTNHKPCAAQLPHRSCPQIYQV